MIDTAGVIIIEAPGQCRITIVPPRTPPDMVRLAECRHDLLLRLGQLHNPTLALAKLAEFKDDIASLGIPATLEKWSE